MPFDNGGISFAPDKWPYGVWAAYQYGDHFVYDWTTAWNDEDAVNYDEFLVSIRDVNHNATSVDVLEDMTKIPGNLLANLFYREDTHLRKQGTFDKKIIDLKHGTYFVNLEGCDLPSSINPFSHSECRQGPLHEMPVEYKDRSYGDFENVDFSKIPVPTTVEESKATLDARIAAVVFREACHPLPWTLYRNEENYTEIALAKLAFSDFFFGDRCPGRDISNREEVNNSLIRLKAESATGTTQDSPPILRQGEYDFALGGLMPMLYRYRQALRPEVFNHAIDYLLPKRGGDWGDDLHVDAVVPESENHINLTESGRYLTNQLLWERTHDSRYNNDAIGLTDWWLKRLHSILITDFIEYNAHPYSRQSTTAIQNLYSYTTDPRVRTAAKMVLDYVSAKIAVSSIDARRSVPYRRKKEYYDDRFFQHPDANMLRSILLAGNTKVLGEVADGFYAGQCTDPQTGIRSSCKWWGGIYAPANFALEMLMAGMSSYRIPDPILDLIVNPAHRVLYQGFQHYGEELYAGSTSYLISAGGRYAPSAYTVAGVGKADDIGLAVPTTFIPGGAYLDRAAMVRFLGYGEDDERYNMCVAPDFACGTRYVVPDTYPARSSCSVDDPPWLFYNRSGSCAHINVRTCGLLNAGAASRGVLLPGSGTAPRLSCPPQPGYYLAVYRGGGEDSWGLLEAYDTALHKELSFPQFVWQVKHNNSNSFNPAATNTYVTARGIRVQFVIRPKSRVVSVTPPPTPPAQHMFLWGDVMTSDGSGLITITNPYTHQQATLDDRGYQNPVYSNWRFIPPPSPRPYGIDKIKAAKPGPVSSQQKTPRTRGIITTPPPR